MKPIYIHSGMVGAPQYANADGNINSILEACLVTGFNTRTATSASANGGVLTLNFGSDPGFEALQTVEVAVSSVAFVNGQHRVVANSNNQVTIAIPGLPDGAVGSGGAGITIKQAGSGWTKPFGNSTTSVFKQPAGSQKYVRAFHQSSFTFQARGYDDMTDVNTGTNPFPTAAQVENPYVMDYSGQAGARWFVQATDKWFSFSLSNGPVDNSNFNGFFFFGDPLYPTVLNGTGDTLITTQGFAYFNKGHAGNNSQQATIQHSVFPTPAWGALGANEVRFFPYVPIQQNGDSVIRGFLPCAYFMLPYGEANKFTQTFLDVVGVSGRMHPIGFTANQRPQLAIALDEDI